MMQLILDSHLPEKSRDHGQSQVVIHPDHYLDVQMNNTMMAIARPLDMQAHPRSTPTSSTFLCEHLVMIFFCDYSYSTADLRRTVVT